MNHDSSMYVLYRFSEQWHESFTCVHDSCMYDSSVHHVLNRMDHGTHVKHSCHCSDAHTCEWFVSWCIHMCAMSHSELFTCVPCRIHTCAQSHSVTFLQHAIKLIHMYAATPSQVRHDSSIYSCLCALYVLSMSSLCPLYVLSMSSLCPPSRFCTIRRTTH